MDVAPRPDFQWEYLFSAPSGDVARRLDRSSHWSQRILDSFVRALADGGAVPGSDRIFVAAFDVLEYLFRDFLIAVEKGGGAANVGLSSFVDGVAGLIVVLSAGGVTLDASLIEGLTRAFVVTATVGREGEQDLAWLLRRVIELVVFPGGFIAAERVPGPSA